MSCGGEKPDTDYEAMDSLRCLADLAIAGSLRDDINVLDVSQNGGYHSNRGENE